MPESIAEGLSVAALVAGFPLLLLAFMVSLEKLESWGLREPEVTDPGDRVDAAVEAIEQLSVAARSEREAPIAPRSGDGSSAAGAGSGDRSAPAAAGSGDGSSAAAAGSGDGSSAAGAPPGRKSTPAGRSRD